MRRGGVLLELRRDLEVDLLLRRIKTGEWLGSRFHRSRLSKDRPRNAGLLRRETERDLLDRDRRALDRERDLLFLAGERDLDLLFRVGDLDFDRFRLGDFDFERFALV